MKKTEKQSKEANRFYRYICARTDAQIYINMAIGGLRRRLRKIHLLSVFYAILYRTAILFFKDATMKTMNKELARIEKMTVETTAFSAKEVKDARLARYIASVDDAVDMSRVISASSVLRLTQKDVSIMFAMADMAEGEQLDFFKLQRATQKNIMSDSCIALDNGTKIYKRASLVTTADVLRAIMILNAFDSRYHIQLCKDGATKILADASKKSLLRSSFYLTGDADANGKKVRRTVAFNDSFNAIFLNGLKQCQGKHDLLAVCINTELSFLDVEKMETIASIDKKKEAEKTARTQEARADKKAANA